MKRFELVEGHDGSRGGPELGRGTEGVVRLCKDVHTQRLFACKRFYQHKGAATSPSGAAAGGNSAAGRREIQMMRLVQGVRGVVQLECAVTGKAGDWFMVMELCEGGDLQQYLEKVRPGGRLSEREAAMLARALAGALAGCHERGLAHRDVKLGNVLLARKYGNEEELREEDIRLADFGLAAAVQVRRRAAARLVDRASADFEYAFTALTGTPGYLAPEVIRGSYDERADVWSLGVVLYCALLGTYPFGALDEDCVLWGDLDLDRPGLPNSLSPPARHLLSRLLDKDPAHRITLPEVLAHPWLQNTSTHDDDHHAMICSTANMAHPHDDDSCTNFWTYFLLHLLGRKFSISRYSSLFGGLHGFPRFDQKGHLIQSKWLQASKDAAVPIRCL